jgi:AraC-like DNA-binding protein
MIKNGQGSQLVSAQSILGVGYKNPRFPTLGIESLRLSELLGRVPAAHFSLPQRPGFHLMLLFTSGSGDYFLDFRKISCRSGTLIHARPGQVQQFVLGQTLEADVLLFTPEFLLPAIAVAEAGYLATLIDDVVPDGVAQLEPDGFQNIRAVLAATEQAYKTTTGSDMSAAILQHLLYATLFTAARDSVHSDAAPITHGYRTVVKKFLRALEERYRKTRKVDSYAQAIGYPTKSLRRACLMVAGSTPKSIIEQRLILEAKRLLVHTDNSVQAIAGVLGFSEPTNFVKFFKRHGGMGPLEFRVRFPGARANRRSRLTTSNPTKPS